MDRTNPPLSKITTKLDKDLRCDQGEEIRIDKAAFHEHLNRAETLAQLNNFGLWMLNIQEAAELIACDMWATGDIEIDALNDFSGPLRAPEVKAALADVISVFMTRITNAIEIGRLKSEHVRRDFDENIIPTETFIGFQPLEEWLNTRGYSFGDAFADWQDEEITIADKLVDELIWLRGVKGKFKSTGLLVGYASNPSFVDETNPSELLAAYKSAVLENEHLRERLAKAESGPSVKAEPPVSPRHRRTLLTLIGALCEDAGIDVSKRGVAQRIMKMTEQVGAPIDDETIRQILADIPDAIESRSR